MSEENNFTCAVCKKLQLKKDTDPCQGEVKIYSLGECIRKLPCNKPICFRCSRFGVSVYCIEHKPAPYVTESQKHDVFHLDEKVSLSEETTPLSIGIFAELPCPEYERNMSYLHEISENSKTWLRIKLTSPIDKKWTIQFSLPKKNPKFATLEGYRLPVDTFLGHKGDNYELREKSFTFKSRSSKWFICVIVITGLDDEEDFQESLPIDSGWLDVEGNRKCKIYIKGEFPVKEKPRESWRTKKLEACAEEDTLEMTVDFFVTNFPEMAYTLFFDKIHPKKTGALRGPWLPEDISLVENSSFDEGPYYFRFRSKKYPWFWINIEFVA